MKVKLILKCNRCGAALQQEKDIYRNLSKEEQADPHPPVGEWGKYRGMGFILDDVHRCDATHVGTAVFIGYDILER